VIALQIAALYLVTLSIAFSIKKGRNTIRDRALKSEAFELRRNVKNFIKSYIKTALQKIGLTV
jgi:hypothetical protein